MYLEKISIFNYRNISELSLELSSGVNVFVGKNGVGKTNFLDAVYYLSFCKSFSSFSDALNIRFKQDFFLIDALYSRNQTQEHIVCSLKRNQKKVFKRNKNIYKKLADHIGLIPLVLISPADSSLITEGSEERRKFIDGVISQFDRIYLTNLLKYNRILLQRNTLLRDFADKKTFNAQILDVYNLQLSTLGDEIFKKRQQFIEDLIPVFQDYYNLISGNREKVSLEYSSKLHEKSLYELLTENLEKDKILQYTSKGIHRDELSFKLSGYSLKKVGSQGQQKSFLLALKLAQYSYIYQITGIKPILLLDDIFDKLDSERVKNLIETVGLNNSEKNNLLFGQIFITDTNENRIKEILESNNFNYKIINM